MEDFEDADMFDAFSEVPVSKRSEGKPVEDIKVEESKPKASFAAPATPKAKPSEPEDDFGSYVEQKIVHIPQTGDQCKADICYPPNWDVEKSELEEKEWMKQPKPAPAKTYPFTLDPFQRQAVNCLERNQSVLVSAHTSAGKTVVAEYAIAMSLRDGQRVIYTSPIKALSNQKYRELYAEFEDVGLMTGDITINPSASCLVMTTEILRNMLYRGSEVMREVAWVIFDEIHYMRNPSRGVVWEETIILLPDKCRHVFLSATIPNANEFACWIAKLHSQPCRVVYTDYRPTPLQHYIFPCGGDGLYLAVDEKGVFRDSNFQKALAVLKSTEASDIAPPDGETGKKKRKKKQKGTSDMYKIIRMIMDRKFDPVIVFSFSKRDCEEHALHLAKLDFCDVDEKNLITSIFKNAMDSLSDDDKNLPAVQNILPLLKRGIGIHHGGLLPILKEVIEILFQEGLLKCLFSTETFSMGLNMPARTVVFASAKKFDGTNFRPVSSGEYIQMSGRAGRRGLDDKGIVILMLDEDLEPDTVKDMIKGSSDPLNSAFHLGYNMLLNLIRVEEANPEYMMLRSFRQFQINRQAPKLMEELSKHEADKNAIVLKDAKGIAEYFFLKTQIDRIGQEIQYQFTRPINILPFLNPGRLAKVKDGSTDWGWGVIVNFQKCKPERGNKRRKVKPDIDGSNGDYIVDIMFPCKLQSKQEKKRFSVPEPCPDTQDPTANMQVIPVKLNLIQKLSTVRLYCPKEMHLPQMRKMTGKILVEASKRFKDGIPPLDPFEDMKIKDEAFVKLVRKVEDLEEQLLLHKYHQNPELKEQYQLHQQKETLETKISETRVALKNATQDIELKQKLAGMRRVLRRLGHITENSVIAVKGRVACEISTCNELVATELMFNGFFNDLETPQIVAVLSCLVFTEKSKQKAVRFNENLAGPLRQLQEAAKRVGQVIIDARIPLELEEFVESFQPGLMEVVMRWCQGSKFSELVKLTDAFEGTIIRCMRRLEELLRQFGNAARSIGNNKLEEQFTKGQELLKRDIVFAASLYL